MKFGEKIYQLRKRKGISQEELGQKLNVTRQTVSKWELGQTKPDADKLKEMSAYFNVGLEQLTDDNIIIEAKEKNEYRNADELRPRKWLLVVLIILALVISVVLINKVVLDINAKKSEENVSEKGSFFDNLENFFKTGEINSSDSFESDSYESDFDEYDISSFNSVLEMYDGTKHGHQVGYALDEVVTSNKKNENHIITVIRGEIVTTDEAEIRNIKKGLDSWTEYEVWYDYDDNGFIYQMHIE